MSGVSEELSNSKKRKEKIIGTVFLTSVAGASALGGFSHALVSAKKQSPSQFAKGLESGASLGIRALGWGTFYAVGGVALLTFGVFRLLGVHNLSEFRAKLENGLKPRVPPVKEANPPGRRDFGSIRELFEHLSTVTSSAPKTPPASGKGE